MDFPLEPTDLKLATQVIIKLGDSDHKPMPKDLEDDAKFTEAFFDGALETIFPRLKSATVVLYADVTASPLYEIFAWADLARTTYPNNNVEFDGVGSMRALLKGKPEIAFRVQDRKLMQHRKDCAASEDGLGVPRVLGAASTSRMTANVMHRMLQSNPGHLYLQGLKGIILAKSPLLAPSIHPPFDPDGFEFWTCAEWFMSRRHFKRNGRRSEDHI